MRPINLLPPEIEEKSKSRRRVMAGILGLIVFAALLAAATFLLTKQAERAEETLANQERVNQDLQTEISALGEVRQIRQSYELGGDRVRMVMADDIAWGRLLNDLARVIPDRVWLNSLSASSTAPVEGSLARGTVAVAGTAFDFPDASTWLRVLDSDVWPALGGAWVSSTTTADIGEFGVISFASQASLTEAAISNRAVDRVPEVTE